MLFELEDIFLVLKAMTDAQRGALEEAATDQDKFFQILAMLGLGYWRKFLELVNADTQRVANSVSKALLSDRYLNRQLGVTVERLLYQFLKNNQAWLNWLRERGCELHPNAIEVVLFNGIQSGEFDRFLDTLRLLRSSRAHVVYSERVCPCYNKECLFCENGIQYFPAGTVYDEENEE